MSTQRTGEQGGNDRMWCAILLPQGPQVAQTQPPHLAHARKKPPLALEVGRVVQPHPLLPAQQAVQQLQGRFVELGSDDLEQGGVWGGGAHTEGVSGWVVAC